MVGGMGQRIVVRPKGGMNEKGPRNIDDADLYYASNVYYNKEGNLQTRRGYRTFGDDLGSSPISSYFFYKREDNGSRIAVCHSGSNVYSYSEGGDTWSSLYTHNHEYETRTAISSFRTRRDHVVYNNILYMCNGVSPYQKYTGTTWSLVGVGGSGTVTADSGTNLLTKAAHGYTENYEIYMTSSGTMPGGLNAYQVYYVKTDTANTFYVTLDPDGTAIDLTTNGTGTISTFDLTERRMRYAAFLNNRLISTGNDQVPTTLYYTNVDPTDATNPNQNSAVVGADEIGRITGIYEYESGVIVFGTKKIYDFRVSGSTVTLTKLDIQGGGYGNRIGNSIDNAILYMSGRGLDILTKRDGASGGSALQSSSISNKLTYAMTDILDISREYSCGRYNKRLGKFFFSIPTGGDDVPDRNFVYDAVLGSFTELVYAVTSIYDYGVYVDSSGNEKQIMACGDGRCYEYDYGWTDNGTNISSLIYTKTYTFGDDDSMKNVEYYEISGWIETSQTLSTYGVVDSTNTDVANIIVSTGDELDLPISDNYDGGSVKTLKRFVKRIPVQKIGREIYIALYAENCQYIIESITIGVSGKVIDLFPYADIL